MFTQKSIQPRQSQLTSNNRNQRMDYTKNSNLTGLTGMTFSGLAFREDEKSNRAKSSNNNLLNFPTLADSRVDLRQPRVVAN